MSSTLVPWREIIIRPLNVSYQHSEKEFSIALQVLLIPIHPDLYAVLHFIVAEYIGCKRTYLFRHFITSRWAVAPAANAIQLVSYHRETGWLQERSSRLIELGAVIGRSSFMQSREDLWLNYCPNCAGLLLPGYQAVCSSTGPQCEKHWCTARWDCQNVSTRQSGGHDRCSVDFWMQAEEEWASSWLIMAYLCFRFLILRPPGGIWHAEGEGELPLFDTVTCPYELFLCAVKINTPSPIGWYSQVWDRKNAPSPHPPSPIYCLFSVVIVTQFVREKHKNQCSKVDKLTVETCQRKTTSGYLNISNTI